MAKQKKTKKEKSKLAKKIAGVASFQIGGPVKPLPDPKKTNQKKDENQ